MHLPYIATLLFLCLIPGTHAQNPANLISPNKVTTVGYWKTGDHVRYHVTQQEASYKGKSEKPYKESSTGYDLRLEVTDSTDTSYTFRLLYSDYIADEHADEFTREIAELSADIPVIYRTDELGSFDTILNLPELQQDLLEKLELSKTIYTNAKKENAELYDLIVDNLKKQFTDLENVEALYLSDISMLHGYYGIELQNGKPLDLELYYVTLGDMVLNGTGKLTLTAIQKSKDECTITATEKPNREELKDYLLSLALIFMLDSGKKFSMEELNITMNSRIKMKMELSTGWMNAVTHTSTTKLTHKKGEQRKVVTHEFVRK